MPLLTLEAQSPCPHCGCRLRGFMIGTYRINKNSLRSARGGLTYVECPECGNSRARRHPTGVWPDCDVWRPDAKSQAVIDRHRERKGWST